MTITMCPAALTGTGRCRKAYCRLRHDVVHCKPCKSLVLHDDLRKHRRGEDHRLKCDAGEWKADTTRPARATLQSPYSYVPTLKSLEKLARKLVVMKKVAGVKRSEAHDNRFVKVAGTAKVPAKEEAAREEVARHPSLTVSWEEGLDFKSEVGAGNNEKTKSTTPVIIQKTVDHVGLTLVGVDVTGAGSGGFSAIATSLPMKIKAKKQRTIQVSFVPTAPGECDARLVLRFIHFSKGKSVTLAITRRLHGVATSPVAKPRSLTPQKPGDIKRTPGVRACQMHPGSCKSMQLQGTRRHRGTGRDSPRSY